MKEVGDLLCNKTHKKEKYVRMGRKTQRIKKEAK
jgi:hypothetical protein